MSWVHRVQGEVPAGIFYQIQDLQVRQISTSVFVCVRLCWRGDGRKKLCVTGNSWKENSNKPKKNQQWLTLRSTELAPTMLDSTFLKIEWMTWYGLCDILHSSFFNLIFCCLLNTGVSFALIWSPSQGIINSSVCASTVVPCHSIKVKS